MTEENRIEPEDQQKPKKSKVASAVGFYDAKEAVGTVAKVGSASLNRTANMLYWLKPRDQHIPGVSKDLGAEHKFQASMELHGVDEDRLRQIQSNTYKATILYFAVSLACVVAALISIYAAPPSSLWNGLIRLGPFPVVVALLYKHAYTNYSVRHRRFDNPIAFIQSLDWRPKK